MVPSVHRPTKIKINLEHILDNVETIKQHLDKPAKIYAVVKANAYGHGASQVSRYIEAAVDGFCVSNLDEAIELRQSGITKAIMILGVVSVADVPIAMANNITLTVASLSWFESLLEESDFDLSSLRVQLKLDSGMGRIGVRKHEEVEQLTRLFAKHQLSFEGAFTHFATADEKETSYFEEQLTRFKSLLKSMTIQPKVIHASNSATTLFHGETIFDAVRLGDVLYGMNPSNGLLKLPYLLKPALELESEIVHIKKLEEGQSVGYGATYQTVKKEYIATIPIGYADGWIRKMQGFSVLVDGHYCEIVGRVSMDQITIRLPDYYAIGTKVTLIGHNQDKVITVDQVAKQCDTINYEVICLLSDRISRIYV